MQIEYGKDGKNGKISCNNWNFPTTAKVCFAISHTGDFLYLFFTVEEEDTVADCTTPNGAVWQDSCVEFFCSFDEKYYYNVECNSIGTLHCGYGKSREEREILSKKLLTMITVQSSLGNRPLACKGFCRWTLNLTIPAVFFYHENFSQFTGRSATCNFYKCGDSLRKPHYLSWVPIVTKKPDFHRLEFFAPVCFV